MKSIAHFRIRAERRPTRADPLRPQLAAERPSRRDAYLHRRLRCASRRSNWLALAPRHAPGWRCGAHSVGRSWPHHDEPPARRDTARAASFDRPATGDLTKTVEARLGEISAGWCRRSRRSREAGKPRLGAVRVPDGPGSVRRGLGPCRCPHAWVALPSTPRMVRRSPVESGPDHLPGTLSGGRALSWERGSISASADPAGTRPPAGPARRRWRHPRELSVVRTSCAPRAHRGAVGRAACANHPHPTDAGDQSERTAKPVSAASTTAAAWASSSGA